MRRAARPTGRRELGVFLGVVAVLVRWQMGLFFGVLAATLLAAGSPLLFASLLVRRSLGPGFGPRRRVSWRRVFTFLAGLAIAFGMALVAYRLAQLVSGAVPDDPRSASAVVAGGAMLALFTLALAWVSVVPACYLILAAGSLLRARAREKATR